MAASPDVEVHQKWHDELRTAVANFHQRFARKPKGLDDVRESHTQIIEKLRGGLNKDGSRIVKRLEFVGSAYEGVKVAKSDEDDDLEFDVQYILELPAKWGIEVEEIKEIPGYKFIKLSKTPTVMSEPFIKEMLDEDNRGLWLNAFKAISAFYGEVQSLLNSSDDLKGRTLLRRHGAAVQMDVYKEQVTSHRPYYTVDLVPVIEIEVNKMTYVAKPVKNRGLPDSACWRPLDDGEFVCRESDYDPRVDEYCLTHCACMSLIENQLERLGPTYKMRYAGHKKPNSELPEILQFKIVIIDCGYDEHALELKDIPGKTGMYRMVQRSGKEEQLNGRKETTKLEAILRDCVSTSFKLNGKVHIRRHGPIIQILVSERVDSVVLMESGSKKKASVIPLYGVQVILAYKSKQLLYVSVPKDNSYPTQSDATRAWRPTYAVQLKEEIYGSFHCLKMVLRILKVLVRQNVEMAWISSHHLKTIMVMLKRRYSGDPNFWKENYLGRRLMDALIQLRECIRFGILPDSHVGVVNLLENSAEATRWQTYHRLTQLIENEKQMLDILKTQT